MYKSHTELGLTNLACNELGLLYRFGFGCIWLSQDVGNVAVFLQEFRQRVIDCSAQDWHKQYLRTVSITNILKQCLMLSATSVYIRVSMIESCIKH